VGGGEEDKAIRKSEYIGGKIEDFPENQTKCKNELRTHVVQYLFIFFFFLFFVHLFLNICRRGSTWLYPFCFFYTAP